MPTLTDLATSVTFTENLVNAGGEIIDSNVSFTDAENDFNTGTLIVAGLLAEDTVSIRNIGSGSGQIGFSGSTVKFGGTTIGTASGGAGATFTVTFNSSATSAAIDALIEALTYANSSDAPTASRSLTITVTDAASNHASAAITVDVTAESETGVTIIGSKLDDVVNATTSVAGQPLPTNANDLIQGSKGKDNLSGLGGDDILDGGADDDILSGGAGDDTLRVADKNDVSDALSGGIGTDTIEVMGSGGLILAGFNATTSSIEIWVGNGREVKGSFSSNLFNFSGLTSLTGLKYVDGSAGNDTIIGSNFGDNLLGGTGDDTLNGGQGTDILKGGAGADTFVFKDGYGADLVLDYKAGLDKFDLRGVAGVDHFSDLQLTQVDQTTVLIDFDGIAGGDTLTVQKTTIAILTANQTDFLLT